MTATTWFFTYALLLVLAGAGLFQWRLVAGRQHPPVGIKLLRGPGELTQRARRQLEARLPLTLLGALGLPLLAGYLLVFGVPRLEGLVQFVVAILGWAGVLALLFFGGRHLHRTLNRRHELALRYLGERAIAEELAPLLAQGFRLFHDVAIHGADSRLDLDHVLVGPSGVVVIESETRPRATGKDAERDHEVTFDGRQLVWPWGPDRATVASIEGEAASFTRWLLQTTGYRLQAAPLLTVPGWWVEITGRGLVNVVNHKQLLAAVTARTETFLTPEQVDKICRELELHCRDVES